MKPADYPHLSTQERWQQRCLDRGLCQRCGKRPLVNATNCGPCRDKQRVIAREYYHRKKAQLPTT